MSAYCVLIVTLTLYSCGLTAIMRNDRALDFIIDSNNSLVDLPLFYAALCNKQSSAVEAALKQHILFNMTPDQHIKVLVCWITPPISLEIEFTQEELTHQYNGIFTLLIEHGLNCTVIKSKSSQLLNEIGYALGNYRLRDLILCGTHLTLDDGQLIELQSTDREHAIFGQRFTCACQAFGLLLKASIIVDTDGALLHGMIDKGLGSSFLGVFLKDKNYQDKVIKEVIECGISPGLGKFYDTVTKSVSSVLIKLKVNGRVRNSVAEFIKKYRHNGNKSLVKLLRRYLIVRHYFELYLLGTEKSEIPHLIAYYDSIQSDDTTLALMPTYGELTAAQE
jgi:hypothetical protein